MGSLCCFLEFGISMMEYLFPKFIVFGTSLIVIKYANDEINKYIKNILIIIENKI